MRAAPRAAYFAAFTLSGFAGLIYESIWTHYLKLFLGHAAHAQTLVLAIFMGGMALGSWACSRLGGRWRNLLRAYALAEVAIGVLALAFHPVFVGALRLSYDHVLPALAGPGQVTAFKWALSTALILPQTVLLGMTFPLMSAGILRRFPATPGRSISMLYFTNSLGAAAGVLASGFVLVGAVGLPGTIGVAGGLNLLLGAAIWWMAGPSEPAPAAAPRSAADPRARGEGAFLVIAFVTGASSFMYEVGWIRMLSLVLGTSTHAFELMLSAFILGLALGGLWIQRRIDRVPHPVRTLAWVQVAMGGCALATLPVYGSTFEAMRWVMQSVERTPAGYLAFLLSSSGIAMAVMLPATFCAGMTLPLITYVILRRGRGEGSIGAVYAANTVGAIVGVFLAVHAGFPLGGVKGVVVAGAALDLALGVALLWSAGAAFSGRRIPALATAGSAGAVLLTVGLVQLDPYLMASGVYRHGTIPDRAHNRIVFHRDGKTATVTRVEDDLGRTAILTNGKTDAMIATGAGAIPVGDESTMVLLGVAPLLHHPGARAAAVIGLGSGLTTHTLLSYPGLAQVDTVEIEREMIAAANGFRPRVERAFSDPRGRVFVDDAKSFFSSHAKRYDVIVSEPSNPWVSGVAGLFSLEFYDVVRRHLADGGVFVQWVQLYEIDLDLVMSVLKAIDARFEDYAVYAANDRDAIIVATPTGRLRPIDRGVLEVPELAEALRRVDVRGLQDLEIRSVGSRALLHRLVASWPGPANSDFDPVLDQNAARSRFLGASASELLEFTRAPLPVLSLLSGGGAPSGSTPVFPSAHLQRARAAYRAAALKQYVVDGRAPPDEVVPPALLEEAARLRARMTRCDAVPTEPERIGLLVDVAVNTVPYLTPAELDALWRPLTSGACAASVSQGERLWLELFAAQGARDGRRAAAAAAALLEQTRLPEQAAQYVLAAGMLGHLAAHDAPGASSLWDRHGQTVWGRTPPDTVSRLLVAESRRQ